METTDHSILRLVIASEIARHFYHLLQAELKKTTAAAEVPNPDGRTAREVNQAILTRLIQEFPGVRSSPAPENDK